MACIIGAENVFFNMWIQSVVVLADNTKLYLDT